MVDNPNPESPASVVPEAKPASAFVMFMTSSTGKFVLAGVALFIAIVVVGALAFYFLLDSGSQADGPVVTGGGTKPSTETVVPTNPPKQPLDETFTFRNVFAPTVSPATEPVTASTTTTTGTTSSNTDATSSNTSNAPADTLILKSIAVESGEYVATFEWNGATYKCKEGDQVADSPWEVVTINSDSVVMLYGDTRVTLTVGQGFSDGGLESTK